MKDSLASIKRSEDINEIYSKYNSDDEPHETNKMEKTMTWFGIEMRTMTDDSDAKISELLFNGTNMGILEGRRILNDKKMDKEVEEIVDTYVKVQEKNIEDLKKYL